jgi:predicted secreted protein
MTRENATAWSNRISDERGRRVIFVAHCLLNENTRYLGGARRAGAVSEVVRPILDQGIGIVQLPCPEQHAWGGVLKRRLLLFYGSEGKLRYRLRGILLPIMLWYTRRIYRRLARQTAKQICDYQRSGIEVVGIVGVDASPSCGVFKSLDMRDALEKAARLDPSTATTREANLIVLETAVPGRGLFAELLENELERRGLRIPWEAHDLIAELEGDT